MGDRHVHGNEDRMQPAMIRRFRSGIQGKKPKTHYRKQHFSFVVAILVLARLLGNSKDFIVSPIHHVARKEQDGVSLVVGFWAEPQNKTPHPHRIEVELAMLANLENPYLDELVVILDSTTPDSNCRQFLERMQTLRAKRNSSANSTVTLKCIDRPEGQPTYFEMFNYTLSSAVAGRVAVISNADQVFSDSLELAHRVKPDTILFLSTWGYNATEVPIRLREVYLSQHDSDSAVVPSFCFNWRKSFQGTEGQYSLSWDTYIFQPETIRHTLASRNFKRKSFDRQWLPFYMNEFGAENSALYGLLQGLENRVIVWNACKLIQSWHFHLTPKTHREDAKIWPKQAGGNTLYLDKYWGPTARVPGPEANAPICQNFDECSDAFYKAI